MRSVLLTSERKRPTCWWNISTALMSSLRLPEEQLLDIPSIGPRIAESTLAFFRQEQNRNIIEKLRRAGVKLKSEEMKRKDLPLAGLEFVITGRLETFTRQEAENRIKALGGKAGSDISRKTNYVVVGTDPGSKLARAEALGIEKLNEQQLLHKLKEAENTKQGVEGAN